MRFAAGSVFLGLLIAVSVAPASAQAGVNVGGFYCPTKLPCNGGDASFPAMPQLVAMANSCVSSKGAISSTDSLFEVAAGIDSNGCLTANPSAFPMTSGGRVVANCCVVQAPGDSCALYCNMSTQ